MWHNLGPMLPLSALPFRCIFFPSGHFRQAYIKPFAVIGDRSLDVI